MGALDAQLFGAQDDVAAVTLEEGQERTFLILLRMFALSAEQHAKLSLVEVEGTQHGRAGEEVGRLGPGLGPGLNLGLGLGLGLRGAGCWRGAGGFGEPQRGICKGEVGVAAGGRVVGHEVGEETGTAAGAGRQAKRLVLQRSERMLVLQTRTGQARR